MPETTQLSHTNSSARLRAALAIGTAADPRDAVSLVRRSAIEPDFFVRDMLTWALIRMPSDDTVPLLLAELASPVAQARSQALHTLSKIGDPETAQAVVRLVGDDDDEVARSAWRAAAVLVPEPDRADVAALLIGQLGRGDEDLHRSLARALLAMGDAGYSLARGVATDDGALPERRAAAEEVLRLAHDPDDGSAGALHAAHRMSALGAERAAAIDGR